MGLLGSLLRPRTTKQAIGDAGEDAALSYLSERGLKLVERNFRCKGGEIDLIMQDKDVLVFVEVRARANTTHGGAAASITARKQARLILAAQVFLQARREPPPCRFDVVAIDGGEIAWLRNAIDA
jgi:putative endonuclease